MILNFRTSQPYSLQTGGWQSMGDRQCKTKQKRLHFFLLFDTRPIYRIENNVYNQNKINVHPAYIIRRNTLTKQNKDSSLSNNTGNIC